MLAGTVYIDGQERTTKLPSLSRGSNLIFDTEVLQAGKVRITIEIDDKIATFDWNIEVASAAPPRSLISFAGGANMDESVRLYFAMRFAGEGWKIAVE